MKEKSKLKPVSLAVGAAFATSLAMAPMASSAVENPFGMSELSGGYKLADSHNKEGQCGGKERIKEGNCGEDKMGKGKEGNCGAKEQKKAKEGKCGEGKCGSTN